uniref:Uncharacterized protein n=1 Tax=Anopheles stephensi TaxID=30069 RepID=A0A182Y2H0_ANOST
MLLVMVPTVVLLLLGLLFLPGVVQGDYENTWNSYYEQPCCGGTTNGPFHLRHHGAWALFWVFVIVLNITHPIEGLVRSS